jgi:hypothetical protein
VAIYEISVRRIGGSATVIDPVPVAGVNKFLIHSKSGRD